MGDIGHVAAALDGEGQGHDDQDRDEILGFEREGERDQQDFVLAEDHPERDEDSEHSTGRAHGRDRGISQHVGIGERNRGQGRAYDAEGIELHKAARAPGALEGRAKHPDAQHVAKPVPEFKMQEAVGHQLPDGAVDNRLRLERQVVAHPAGDVDQGHAEEFKQQEDGGIDREQPGDRAGEGRQAQRHFSASCHNWLRSFSVKSFSDNQRV